MIVGEELVLPDWLGCSQDRAAGKGNYLVLRTRAAPRGGEKGAWGLGGGAQGTEEGAQGTWEERSSGCVCVNESVCVS